MVSRAVLPAVADGTAGDFALGHDGADVVFGTVGVKRDLGSLENAQQVGFELVQAGQLPVEHDVAGLVGEDPVKAHPQAPGAPWIGVALIGLQVGIEPPDQAALEIDGAAMRGTQRLQLMDEPFGIHPAQGMVADPELAGTIGDDHRVTQQVLVAYRPPECGFGGDLERIGGDLERIEAEPVQMRVPDGFVAKAGLGVVRQRGDLRCRHVHHAHPGERGVVDDIIRAPGLQQQQEGAARLRHRSAEYGEAPVADLSNKAILAGVARRRVIDADPAGRREPGAQHRLVLGCQSLQPLAQQPHDLALGDLEPHAVQQRCQPLTGDLALKVTSSDEAAQLGAKTAEDARRQRCHDPLARRRLPALTAIASRPRLSADPGPAHLRNPGSASPAALPP